MTQEKERTLGIPFSSFLLAFPSFPILHYAYKKKEKEHQNIFDL